MHLPPWVSRTAALAVVVGIVSIGPATTAFADAGPIIHDAGVAIKDGKSVYVDPNAVGSGLTNDDVSKLDSLIANGPHPIYIAVLPIDVRNEVPKAANLPRALYDATDLPGVYAVVAPGVFLAHATERAGVPNADDLARQAYNATERNGRQDVPAELMKFVQLVEAQPVAANSVTMGKPPPWGFIIGGVLAVIVAGVVLFFVLRTRRSHKDDADALKRARSTLDGEIRALNSDITAFNANTPEATAALARAVSLSDSATTALSEATSLEDVNAARTTYNQAHAALEEARRPNGARSARHDNGGTTVNTPACRTSGSSLPFRPNPALRRRPTAAMSAAGGRPAPSHTVNYTNSYRHGYRGTFSPTCYPGTGFGYYPDFGSWGYWGLNGLFVADTLGVVDPRTGMNLIDEAWFIEAGDGFGFGFVDPFGRVAPTFNPLLVEDPFLARTVTVADMMTAEAVVDIAALELAADIDRDDWHPDYQGEPGYQDDMTGQAGGVVDQQQYDQSQADGVDGQQEDDDQDQGTDDGNQYEDEDDSDQYPDDKDQDAGGYDDSQQGGGYDNQDPNQNYDDDGGFDNSDYNDQGGF